MRAAAVLLFALVVTDTQVALAGRARPTRARMQNEAARKRLQDVSKIQLSERCAKRGVMLARVHRDDPVSRCHRACRWLYYATIVNTVISVMVNDYKSIVPMLHLQLEGNRPAAAVYRSLFYFAKLRPRLLFVVGACLRALQQTTVIQLVFDPTVGIGAGLNLLALMTASRWPSALTLGWAASKPFWRLLRASPPPHVNVPITLRSSFFG